MSDPKRQPQSDNLTWHAGAVGPADRAAVLGHGAACLWFTGLSGSGKSTLARALEQELIGRGCAAYVLDGDNLRLGLNSDLSFEAHHRAENIRRVGELAQLFVDAGLLLTTAFISPYRADRDVVRGKLGDRFIEVHLDPGLGVCEQRDPKGLYRRARSGEIKEFTGVSAPYDAPLKPEIVVDTGRLTLAESVDLLIDALEHRGLIR
jgi:adenylylsulfate kinase